MSEGFQRSNNPPQVFSTKLNQENFTPQDFAIDRLNQPNAINDLATNMNNDGSIRRQITHGDKSASSPRFSPDGRTLAFLRGSFAPKAELLLQPLTSDGTPAAPARAVVEEGVAGTNDLSWTPDGRELVVGDWRISPGGERLRGFRLPGRGDPGQWGGRQEQISIRGTRLVFSTPESQLQLSRVSLAGASQAQPAPFLRSTRGENHPAFSPYGRRVAFCSYRSGDRHIWVCDVDGSRCHELPLPRGSSGSCSPSWSPDGKMIEQVKAQYSRVDILVNSAGANPQMVPLEDLE